MIDIPKIVIAPHVTTYVGNLGINEFANDLSKVMNYSASWDRHWRRLTPIKNLQRGDIMIFSYKLLFIALKQNRMLKDHCLYFYM